MTLVEVAAMIFILGWIARQYREFKQAYHIRKGGNDLLSEKGMIGWRYDDEKHLFWQTKPVYDDVTLDTPRANYTFHECLRWTSAGWQWRYGLITDKDPKRRVFLPTVEDNQFVEEVRKGGNPKLGIFHRDFFLDDWAICRTMKQRTMINIFEKAINEDFH